MITHRLNFITEIPLTAEEAALAFVRAHDGVPTERVEVWAASDNPKIAERANALLTARRAMARERL